MSVRILVAEDEALIRMDLVEMLQGAGYEVVAQATNGQVWRGGYAASHSER